MTTWRGLFLAAIGATLAVACGGATALNGAESAEEGTGGSTNNGGGFTTTGGRTGNGTGGRVNAGGKPSTGGTGGSYFGTGGAQICCSAAPSCDYGDAQQFGPCPPGVTCYQRSLCCSTITCSKTTQCTGVPECNFGDKQIVGACPPSYSCYSVSSCGSTITCLSPYAAVDAGPPPPPPPVDGGYCNRDAQYYRSYVGLSLQQCSQIKYTCPSGTTSFFEECGCGCEQSPSCPEWVDCMPSSAPPNVYCTDAGRVKCPYTKRAY